MAILAPVEARLAFLAADGANQIFVTGLVVFLIEIVELGMVAHIIAYTEIIVVTAGTIALHDFLFLARSSTKFQMVFKIGLRLDMVIVFVIALPDAFTRILIHHHAFPGAVVLRTVTVIKIKSPDKQAEEPAFETSGFVYRAIHESCSDRKRYSSIYICPDLNNIMFPVTVECAQDLSFSEQQMEIIRSTLSIIPH